MDPDILQRIRLINTEFYQTFADSFASTRGRLQPGVQRLVPTILDCERVLDLGCGNGELASALVEHGFKGHYLGIDLSAAMLAIARENVKSDERFAFISAELGADQLTARILENAGLGFHPPYDHQVAFASLHHIPGRDAREGLVRELHDLAKPGARLSLSAWNFMDSERLRARVLPWETVGLSAGQVEEGDYLIDWRRDGEGIRYVHHFSAAELSELAEQAGYRVLETFYSDGETGALGLYQIWEA